MQTAVSSHIQFNGYNHFWILVFSIYHSFPKYTVTSMNQKQINWDMHYMKKMVIWNLTKINHICLLKI